MYNSINVFEIIAIADCGCYGTYFGNSNYKRVYLIFFSAKNFPQELKEK